MTTTRPSEPLLAFLREAIRRKGLNTADLANRLSMDRIKLKHRLSGQEELTVDELISLSKALELTAAEMGLAGADTEVEPPPPAPGPDPYGNLPRQIVEQGIALGVDLYFVLDTNELGGSSIPREVLKANPEQLRLRMEARWYAQNKFQFLEEELSVTLSFDRLYPCAIPWSAFRTVTFILPAEPPAPPKLESIKPAAPFLRVVK